MRTAFSGCSALRCIQGLALGSRPFDPLLLGAVTAVLLAVVTIAVAVPAARAARVNPAEALLGS